MTPEKQRRQELLEKMRSPEQREEVFAYLKSLKGIPPEDPLPNGTPIMTEILRLEKAHGIGRCHVTPVDAKRQ